MQCLLLLLLLLSLLLLSCCCMCSFHTLAPCTHLSRLRCRMESTGESGRIHVSAAFAAKLPHESWLATGGVEAKGKGVMQTFLLAEQQFQALKS